MPSNDGEAGPQPDVVTDAILDGRVVLRQFRRGHRAGTDAVLLAAAARVEPSDALVDVGAGVGTVGLALARRAGDLTGVLLEADPRVAALALENCRLNGVDSRLRVALCDLFDPAARNAAGLLNGKASLVVTNPPFFDAQDIRVSTNPLKARAHSLDGGERPRGHADWLRAAIGLLAPKGRFYAIHRPERLPALLSGSQGRLGRVRIMPVHARAEGAAIRILVAGIKGSRAPLELYPSLILHGPDGQFTPRAAALHRGEALLDL